MATFDAASRDKIFSHFGRSMINRYASTLDDKKSPHPASSKAGEVVGIVGAGVGGLYAAIMLESLGVPFEIIEGSDRVGGRLFTHKFDHPQAGKYDYYVSHWDIYIR